MNFSTVLIKLILSVSLTFLGAVGSAWIGSFTVDKNQGLVGGAIVFWYLLFGAIAGMICGFVISRNFSSRLVRKLTLISSLTAAIVFTALYFRYTSKGSDERSLKYHETPVTSSIILASHSFNEAQQPELPLGLGIAAITNAQTLHFFNRPKPDQLPDMVSPMDSISFVGSNNQFDIASAPPYFVPEAMKLDYNILFLRVVGINRYWLEVVVNSFTGQTAFVNREAIQLSYWPDFLININSVEPIDLKANPIRVKPLDHASEAVGFDGPLRVLEVKGDWLKVIPSENQANAFKGYVRWRNNSKLLISYNLLS